jgi:hypothetical protein
MSQYALDFPEALLQEAQKAAQAEQTSLDDFVLASAVRHLRSLPLSASDTPQ